MNNYVALSLETHLFFARIMKEHALFLEAGFPCKDTAWIRKSDWFRRQFEGLLREVVQISSGRVGSCVLSSDELVTKFTLPAENRTESLTGVPIDSNITLAEKRLRSGCGGEESREVCQAVHHLNQRSLRLLDGLIDLKENILREVSGGRLFTANYPLLIQHILREAKCYRSTIETLMRDGTISCGTICGTEEFWNRIMMEHALFIRGLLDPSEEALIDTADDFAGDYEELLAMACQRDGVAHGLTEKTLEETLRYRDFKAEGAQGILDCKIASIILPLLADHVLREANHYIRLLRQDSEGWGE